MQGSILVVQIHEARDLPGALTSYAEVNFGDQRQVTQAKPATNSPLWNEKFSYDVTTGQEEVTISVCSNEFAGGRIIGSCKYTIKSLIPPEYTFEGWLPLKSASDQIVGKVKLSLQWIYSRVEFFTNLTNKVDKQNVDWQNELGFYSQKLEILQSTT